MQELLSAILFTIRKMAKLKKKHPERGASSVSAPGMGVDLVAKVHYGRGSTSPLAKGNGVVVRRGRKEAGGKLTARGPRIAGEAVPLG